MKPLSLSTILKASGINGPAPSVTIQYVGDNIRKIRNRSVIFHLNKERSVNVKRFRRLEHCYIVTDQPLIKNTLPEDKVYYVPNIQAAYLNFARYYRGLFDVKVVAVTGTCGKSSTKEMIAQVLQKKGTVVFTFQSRNGLSRHNDYLMQIDDETKYVVLETALTHTGHILRACELFKPQIGIITTIGIDHLNTFENHDCYIRAKAELLTGLNNEGILIVNNDDENIKKIDMSRFRGKIITFGIRNLSDFYASDISYQKESMSFVLHWRNQKYSVGVAGLGIHTVYNALSAIAALTVLGLRTEEIIRFLREYKPIRSHIEPKLGPNGSIILDDTWSSNPTSVEAAFKVLKDLGINKRKIAVIGRISYLGKQENESYKKIARMFLKNKIDILVTQDTKAKTIGDYLIKEGFDQNKVFHCPNSQLLTDTLKTLLTKDTIALFKWSMLDKRNQAVLNQLTVKKT